MEPRAIAAIVEKIARSPLSVSAYFKRHKLPFGRSRYFQYKAQLAANGLDGLVDGRSGGNRRELTAHAQGCLRGGQAQRQKLLAHGVVPEQRVRSGAQVFGPSGPAADHLEWSDAFGEQPARQCAGTLLRLQLPASHAG